MQMQTTRDQAGRTPDGGWELGVRRTLTEPIDDLWRRLLTEWLPIWLSVDSVPQMVGAPLRRGERVCGRVIGCHVGRRVRVRWTPEALDHETVVQVTLTGVADGTTISLHQEHLLGPAERQALLDHWTDVLDGLPGTIEGPPTPGTF